MNAPTPTSKLNTQIYEEACEWLVHFRAGDADDDVDARRRLDEWLRRSPEHVRAYLEVSAVWEDVASHDPDRKIDADGHIARALSERNVYPLESGGNITPAPSVSAAPSAMPARSVIPAKAGAQSKSYRSLLSVAAAVATLSVGALIAWTQLRAPTYETSIGEQRSIALDDGSRIELNARSRIRVQFTEEQRSVELLEGQALFRVAKDSSRPFVVSSDKTRVRAVGTQFDVNRRKAGTVVTVLEGRVGVESGGAQPSPASSNASTGASAPGAIRKATEVFLDAGQQLTVTPTAVAPPKRANIAAATAWTQRQLVFDSAPLSEVAEEFNRYNKRPIVIEDHALESFGVIGVFSSADPSSLLSFLRDQPEIVVVEGDSRISITRR